MGIFESQLGATTFVPAYTAVLVGILIVVSNSRRLTVACLVSQYVFMAWLTIPSLGIQVAATKAISGLLASAILTLAMGTTKWPNHQTMPRSIPTSRSLRLSAAFLMALATVGLGQSNWMGLPNLSPDLVMGATVLMGFGLLLVGLFDEPIRAGIGLMMTISGFEVMYSAVEPSMAVIALLAAVHMGIAVVVSYFASLDTRQEVKSLS